LTRLAKIAAHIIALVGVGAALAAALPAGTESEIRDRIKPFGQLCLAGDDCAGPLQAAASGSMTGDEVYSKFCFVCHQAAVAGAPLTHDAAQWAPRLAKGMDELVNTTVSGMNAMPPMGTCMGCSDEEIAAAIDYMSGSK
jgi:cytochrome c5